MTCKVGYAPQADQLQGIKSNSNQQQFWKNKNKNFPINPQNQFLLLIKKESQQKTPNEKYSKIATEEKRKSERERELISIKETTCKWLRKY